MKKHLALTLVFALTSAPLYAQMRDDECDETVSIKETCKITLNKSLILSG